MLLKDKKQSGSYYQYQINLFNNKNKLGKHHNFLSTYFTFIILFPIFSFISLALHLCLNIWIPVFYYNWSNFYNLNNTIIPQIAGNLFLVPNLVLNLTGAVDILLLIFLFIFFCTFGLDKTTPFRKMPNIFKWVLFIDFLFLIISTAIIYFLIWILNNVYNPTLDNWALNPSISLSLSIQPVLINVSIVLTLSTIFVTLNFASFTWFVFNNKFYSILLNLLNIIKYVKFENEFKDKNPILLNDSLQEEAKPYNYPSPIETSNNSVIDTNSDDSSLVEEIEKMIIEYDEFKDN